MDEEQEKINLRDRLRHEVSLGLTVKEQVPLRARDLAEGPTPTETMHKFVKLWEDVIQQESDLLRESRCPESYVKFVADHMYDDRVAPYKEAIRRRNSEQPPTG